MVKSGSGREGKITFFWMFLVRTDINAVIGEVNLLLRGKLKQFRGLCEANVVCKENYVNFTRKYDDLF